MRLGSDDEPEEPSEPKEAEGLPDNVLHIKAMLKCFFEEAEGAVDRELINSYIKYTSLTTQMAVIIIAGSYFGKHLDSKYSTDSLYTIIFSLLSVFLSLYYVLKQIIRHNAKK